MKAGKTASDKYRMLVITNVLMKLSVRDMLGH